MSAPRAAAAPHGIAAMLPIGRGLAALGVAFMAVGLGTRLAGARGELADLLSMDAPGSLARLYVTGVLASAAVIAALGARWRAGRRTWWGAVGVIAGILALTKAAGDVHSRVVASFGDGLQAWRGMVVMGLLAVAGITVLWRLSAGDRRDRRRVLGVLSAHAVAAVGLSAVSSYAYLWGGDVAGAVATFVEETGEAVTAVALLVVVLVGVLPALVLPEGTVLRRRDDEIPDELTGLAAPPRTVRGAS